MRQWMLPLGPAFAILLGVVAWFTGLSVDICFTVFVTVWTALWWVFEPIPIPVTSLLPLALLPLLGVLTPQQTGAALGSPLVLLFLGGFMLSSAMERSGTHRRLALGMITLIGATSGRRLVIGFMAASAGLSMWMSNSATTLMLLPIVLAVLENVTNRRLRIALLLGVAYAASVGGTATPIGTPPNLVFLEVYKTNVGVEVSFVEWMTWALPVVIAMIPFVAIWLTRGIKLEKPIQIPEVGDWRTEEIRTLIVFAVTATLWVTRTSPFGGWSDWTGLHSANDASIALLAVVAMFLIPNGRGERLLDWETAVQIPWGILLLFGSGIAIAKAFIESGLSDSLGDALAGTVQLMPPYILLILVCLAVTFLTEITSNTATANLLMPILAAAAIGAGIDPKLLMVPATISASFAFMLPVATGPNAVIFGSEEFSVREMAKEGLVLNLVGVVIVSTICYFQFG